MPADLHIHSDYSDSNLSVSQIIKYAEEIGLSHISITDHDILDGIFEAEKKAKSVEIIPGVEIGCSGRGNIEEIHILGYFIDPDYENLKKFLLEIRKGREKRVEKIVKKLKNKGINIELDEVKRISHHGAVGRLHIARVLFEKNMGISVLSCFEKYLLKGGLGWVERENLPEPDSAIEIIKKAGGVPILAHPYDTIGLLPELIKFGLMGVEAIHPKINKSLYKYIIRKAEDYNLLITGGSDCHGTMKDETIVMGKWTMDEDMTKNFIEKASLYLMTFA